MIGLLGQIYAAINGKYAAHHHYLKTKLARVHLADQLVLLPSPEKRAELERQDAVLVLEGQRAIERYEQFKALEEEAKARINREARANEYRNALYYKA